MSEDMNGRRRDFLSATDFVLTEWIEGVGFLGLDLFLTSESIGYDGQQVMNHC